MKRWMTWVLVRLYPRSWRERYGEEFTALLAQQHATLHDVVDVAGGAFDAHRLVMRRCGARREERNVARRQRGMLCSFCGKNQDQAQRLIAGPNGVFICDQCVALCNEILAEAPPAPTPPGATPQGEVHHAHTPWWRRLRGGWQASTRHSDLLGQGAGV